MTTGTIDRLRTMPIPGATVLVGHTLASLVRNLVATAVVVLVALAVGYRPEPGLVCWVGAAGAISLWIPAITALYALLGLVVHSPQAAGGYGFILLLLPYASSAFAPVDTMPAWLQGFAGHQPVTPVIESIRALLAGSASGGDAMAAVLWTVGVAVLVAAPDRLDLPAAGAPLTRRRLEPRARQLLPRQRARVVLPTPGGPTVRYRTAQMSLHEVTGLQSTCATRVVLAKATSSLIRSPRTQETQ